MIPRTAVATSAPGAPATLPPFDIDTMEPTEPPWQAIKEKIPDDEPNLNWFNQAKTPPDSEPDPFHQSPDWGQKEVPLGDGRTPIPEDS